MHVTLNKGWWEEKYPAVVQHAGWGMAGVTDSALVIQGTTALHLLLEACTEKVKEIHCLNSNKRQQSGAAVETYCSLLLYLSNSTH
jgi:hypothetical protein